MSLIQIVVLALVQGVTEFLPISSSGHLILVPMLTDWPDQGLVLDVAVHIGTLGAVLIYLAADIGRMLRGVATWRGGHLLDEPGRRLATQLVIASLPVIFAGAILAGYGGEALRGMAMIGWTMLGFGILLYLADRFGARSRQMEAMTFGAAFLIGLAQMLALIPGTSRSGITITAARLLGFERTDAARFSMLLSIPTILAAGSLIAFELIQLGDLDLGMDALIAASLALISALLAIVVMMRWLKTASFLPFVIYRIVLGVLLLIMSMG